jgi:transposase
VRDVLAMIIGRILYQGSKLSLSRQWKNSTLWELCGTEGPVDVNEHCYAPLDRLLERQDAIQKKLAKTHLTNGCIVLYDITSSYFEGQYEQSELVQFGYNRDGKRGHEQIVIGLLTNAEGCPVAVEVFPGNTQDAATVEGKVRELRERYGISELVFVGDRGMITASNEEKLALLTTVT